MNTTNRFSNRNNDQGSYEKRLNDINTRQGWKRKQKSCILQNNFKLGTFSWRGLFPFHVFRLEKLGGLSHQPILALLWFASGTQSTTSRLSMQTRPTLPSQQSLCDKLWPRKEIIINRSCHKCHNFAPGHFVSATCWRGFIWPQHKNRATHATVPPNATDLYNHSTIATPFTPDSHRLSQASRSCVVAWQHATTQHVKQRRNARLIQCENRYDWCFTRAMNEVQKFHSSNERRMSSWTFSLLQYDHSQ